MRVSYVSRSYPRDIAPGSGSVAYNLAKRIPGKVLFIAKRSPGVYLESPPNVELVVRSYWEPKVPEKLGLVSSLWIALGKSIGSGWFLLRTARTMIRFRADIVHIHTILLILFGLFAKFLLRRPVVMTFHGTDFVRFRRSHVLQKLVDFSVDVVICVSQRMADDAALLQRRTKVVRVPNGVDLEVFEDLGRRRLKRIAAVGDLKWQKGYEYLLRAMRIVVDEEADAQLCIAGTGPLEKELRGLSTSLCLDDNVRFLGAIPQAQVVELLNESRVFVMASVSEGFPRALLEAMACGTPAVVTDVGECPTVVEGAGYTTCTRSAEAIAQAILSLMVNDHAWRSYSEQAVKNALRYTWDETSRRTSIVYRELLESR